MIRFFNFFLISIAIFYFNISHAVQSDWGGIDEAKVRIISPVSKTGENSIFFLGLEYQLQNGWKTYWRAPGEGGFPQTLDWSRSTNISSLEILWPTPQEFEILGIKSLGYEDEVVFPIKIELDEITQPSTFLFDINFLTCKDICLPGQASLQLILPAGVGQTTSHSYDIEKYLSNVPTDNNIISEFEITNVLFVKNNKSFFINIEAKSQNIFKNPKIFLDSSLGLPVISPQYIYSADRKKIKASFIFDKSLFNVDEFDLSIFLSDKNNSIEYKTSVKKENISNLFITNQSNLYIFIISLLGGLILNIMPCVLPVLSIKLLSIITNRQTPILSIRKSFIITSFGIISSFILLALILISLKLSGTSIGWGMQFQQPLFLMIISLILFLFSLNLFGFFEFSLPNFINNFLLISSTNKKYYSDYFNGFFATILATPCSAPFVGVAITAAFTQSALIMIGIFFFMGLGMATPYLLVSLFPKLIWLVPKPGKWINIVKYILAIFLLVTLGWIGMILNNHFNYLFIISGLVLALIVLVSFKYFHKIKILTTIIFLAIFLSFNYIPIFKQNIKIDESNWIDLTKVNIENLIDNNNIIFVDITADWCATCQFNKINVINSKKIQALFKDNNVVKIRGDWTKPNKKIEKYLNSFHRFGIPFNVMYNQSYPEGIILSELLTTSEVINAINKLKNNSY